MGLNLGGAAWPQEGGAGGVRGRRNEPWAEGESETSQTMPRFLTAGPGDQLRCQQRRGSQEELAW